MQKTMADLAPVHGSWYVASFHAPTQLIKLTAPKAKFSSFLPLVSACDQPGKRDETLGLSDFRVKKSGRATVVTFREKSALWDRKDYTIEFGPERIVYRYKVFGKGPVSRAHFFRSWFRDPITVEEELGVVPGFDTVFSPAVNFMGKTHHFPGDTSIITCGDEHLYWGAGLVAAPYCFAFNDRRDKLWVWAGLGVRPGRYTFEEFTWNANETKRIFGAGGFDCNYNGKLHVDGSWQSPDLILGASGGEYEAMEDYVRVVERDYGPKLPRRRKVPSWWKEPIFCGWGEQMSLSFIHSGNVEGVDLGSYCTQARHDEWLGILRAHDIRPGQIIIDAGWSRPGTMGDMIVDENRWPDLRRWIEARRAEGIRTHLWMCAWNMESVPPQECVTKDGKPVNVDPTNPAYEKRLRAMVRRLLSDAPGCYNADGLKIDGELNCPTGPGLINRGNLWGLELQRKYLSIVHSEAKRVKPDAAVGTFTANPYLAEFGDIVRTADMFSIRPAPTETMIHRAKIISIAQPGCLIDTDHAFWYDLRDNWIDIMQEQLACGIPCLYHAKFAWHKRPFARPWIETMTDAHYAAIRKAFEAYRKKLKR